MNMKKKLRNSSSLSEKDKYLIVRENSWTPNSGSNSQNTVSVQGLHDTNNAFKTFLENHSSYDLVPDSSKLVVLDKSLNVQKAFYALIYNGVRAALIWDGSCQAYMGMFTITDFIKILREHYRVAVVAGCSTPDADSFQQLEEQDIDTWRSMHRHHDSDLVELASVGPEQSLKEAVQALLRRRVHRLPVIDPANGNPLHIITHKRLLKYLYMNLYHLPQPSFMSRPIGQIPLGTYGDVCAIHPDQTIIHAFNLFLDRRVSALPVIDNDGRLLDIYSKFDAIHLAATRTYHLLERHISEVIQLHEKKFKSVATCTREDTLHTVLDQFNTHEVHRLVIVDSQMKVEGIISLSDVLEFFIRHHPNDSGDQ